MAKKESVERKEEIVRLVETDLDGKKPVRVAIRSVRGVSFSLGNAISDLCGFGDKRVGELTEAEQKRFEELVTNPEKAGIPKWLLNRRKDPDTGEDNHLAVSKLDLTHKMDINRLKKVRCYRGVRHNLGLPVRGQRTRSSFRKGRVVGVSRKKQMPATSKKKGDKK